MSVRSDARRAVLDAARALAADAADGRQRGKRDPFSALARCERMPVALAAAGAMLRVHHAHGIDSPARSIVDAAPELCAEFSRDARRWRHAPDVQVVDELHAWADRWPETPAEAALRLSDPPPIERPDEPELAPGLTTEPKPEPDPHADLRARAAAALAARAGAPGRWWPIETRSIYAALVEWLCRNAPGAAFPRDDARPDPEHDAWRLRYPALAQRLARLWQSDPSTSWFIEDCRNLMRSVEY